MIRGDVPEIEDEADEVANSGPVPASVPRRLAAAAVDYVWMMIYIGALIGVSVALGAGSGGRLDGLFESPARAHLIGFMTLTAPIAMILAAAESSAFRGTPGKLALGLRVVPAAGGTRLSVGQAALRAFAKLAPWEIAHAAVWRIPDWPAAGATLSVPVMLALAAAWALGGAYVVAPVVDRQRRTPYDRLAGSIVINASGHTP